MYVCMLSVPIFQCNSIFITTCIWPPQQEINFELPEYLLHLCTAEQHFPWWFPLCLESSKKWTKKQSASNNHAYTALNRAHQKLQSTPRHLTPWHPLIFPSTSVRKNISFLPWHKNCSNNYLYGEQFLRLFVLHLKHLEETAITTQ